jgi:uncharacterized protein YbjT (DUF2867 family)
VTIFTRKVLSFLPTRKHKNQLTI